MLEPPDDPMVSGNFLIAQNPTRIKDAPDPATLWPELCQQSRRRCPEHRMSPGRSDVEERFQHESAPMRFGVRQDEPPPVTLTQRPSKSQSTEIYNVEIERSRPPVDT